MKNVAIAMALLLGLALSSGAQAGEPNLKALGLGGMKKMSQPEAKQVRGQGAIAWGGSIAVLPGAFDTNGYFATGNFVAGGVNFSSAFRTSGFGPFATSTFVSAGGFSGGFGF
ncbi:MAG: hypothetical protein AAF483_20300 [Planctomycetota bacterium]